MRGIKVFALIESDRTTQTFLTSLRLFSFASLSDMRHLAVVLILFAMRDGKSR